VTAPTTATGTLSIALELGQDKWLLACATQAAEKPRFRPVPARDLDRLADEIAKAKARFQLPPEAPVRTCYEAGRDGFWLDRALTSRGIDHVVVDSRSIEVDRRRKQVKTDPVDAGKLLNLLCRYHGGERKVWTVVHVPTVADEDWRQLHRGLKDLQRRQTECSNRIRGLLASCGLEAAVDAGFRTTLAELRDWAGQPVPAQLQRRLLQEFAVWETLHWQVRDAANEQERRLREDQEPYAGAEAADRLVALCRARRVTSGRRGEGLAPARGFDGAAARQGGGRAGLRRAAACRDRTAEKEGSGRRGRGGSGASEVGESRRCAAG
jgi:transposase